MAELLSQEEINDLLYPDGVPDDIAEEQEAELLNSVVKIDNYNKNITTIYEFNNGNFVSIDEKKSIFYNNRCEHIEDVVISSVIGFYNNKLLLMQENKVLIYSEDVELIDSYEIEDISEFKTPAILNDETIITSCDIMYKHGLFAMDSYYLDNKLIVWKRGVKDKVLTPHLTGCRVSISDKYIITIGSDGYVKFFNFEFEFLKMTQAREIKKIDDETFLVNNQEIIDLKKVDYKEKIYIDNSGTAMCDELFFKEKEIVVTSGAKNINLWHISSTNPINTIDVNGQISYIEKVDEMILVQLKKESMSNQYFQFYDLNGILINEIMFEHEDMYYQILQDNKICFFMHSMHRDNLARKVYVYNYKEESISSDFYAIYSKSPKLLKSGNLLFIYISKTQIYFEIETQNGEFISRFVIDCSKYFDDLTSFNVLIEAFEVGDELLFIARNTEFLEEKCVSFTCKENEVSVKKLEEELSQVVVNYSLDYINNRFVFYSNNHIYVVSKELEVEQEIDTSNYDKPADDFKKFLPKSRYYETFDGHFKSSKGYGFSFYMPKKITWMSEGYIAGELDNTMVINDDGYIKFIQKVSAN